MINLSPPRFLQRWFPNLIWNIPNDENSVFLTFDDGPTPEVTPWVLEMLRQYNAKATFFCLARNAERHPDLFARIVAEGHAIGNHSYSHLKGWGTSTKQYLEDIDYASTYLNTNLFRPPYGRFTPKQFRLLRERYRVVLWSIISMDYSRCVSGRRVAQYVMSHIKPGDIVVFHDSLKAERNLRYALPFVLETIAMRGYTARAITL